MLLDVALDLVLHEIGDDRVQHRAEDEVFDSRRTRSVDDREAHLPFFGVQGRPDVIDRADAVHGPGEHARVRGVADQHLDSSQRAEVGR